jgi:hypothetical protein
MSLTFKKILIVLVSTAFSISLNAQYKFGVHAGWGLSNYLGKDFPSDNQPKFGPVAGFYYEHELNLTVSIGTEVNYERKGTSYNYYPRVATNISCNSNLDYISVPLLMKFYIDYNAFYYFYGGVSGAYLMNSSNKVSVTEYGYEITPETFFNYKFRKFDASVLAGFGVNFKEVILDFRYQYGIIDIYKGDNTPDIRNSFISATLGFTIYKKKVMHCLNPLRRIK